MSEAPRSRWQRRSDSRRLREQCPARLSFLLVATSRRAVRTACRAARKKRYRFTILKAACAFVACFSIWQPR